MVQFFAQIHNSVLGKIVAVSVPGKIVAGSVPGKIVAVSIPYMPDDVNEVKNVLKLIFFQSLKFFVCTFCFSRPFIIFLV